MMSLSEASLRAKMVAIAAQCSRHRFFTSTDGNLSCRLSNDQLLVTPAGCAKCDLNPDDLIIVDMEGAVISAPAGCVPTSELAMHLTVYHYRPDVNAVLHAHPPYATALTVAGQPFPEDMIPEVLMTLGGVPTAPYARPGTPAMGEAIIDLIKAHDHVLLSHHGSLCLAANIEQALIDLQRIEHTARVYAIAKQLGGVHLLPPDEITALRSHTSSG